MDTTRREFLGRVAANAAALGAMPLAMDFRNLGADAVSPAAPQPGQNWDVSWVGKLTGKHKAIFDVPEVESGYGFW
ncbi:MAG TPA: twin-arginine translocation signal domain-containing protein, partial [Gemmatimonadaceae bacterium]|nr:twin-arginine translocation signal domain-containing protein [Gemmatimonadaceae bacterium]